MLVLKNNGHTRVNFKLIAHIDRSRALEVFRAYTENYDADNTNIAIKIAHTYRVASISERIAETISEANVNFAWLLGLLHDIGRFEQVTRYGTFFDALSIDHAELGADILFHDNLFGSFVPQESQEMKAIAETAIRLHNKLSIPENMEEKTAMYAKILRDADKVDIFRVLTEYPYNERYSNLKDLVARDEVMKYVKEHRCVPREASAGRANELEMLIAQCCMAFELEYPESRAIVIEQGYLKKLLEKDSEQLAIVKAEILKALGKTISPHEQGRSYDVTPPGRP